MMQIAIKKITDLAFNLTAPQKRQILRHLEVLNADNIQKAYLKKMINCRY